MSIDKISQLTSLLLTLPMLIGCVIVVYIYLGPAWVAWRQRKWTALTAQDWLIIGIVISFIGKIFDNSYWTAAWTSELYDLKSREFLFTHGNTPNIPFRILSSMAAAWCHIKAAMVFSEQSDKHVVTNCDYLICVAAGIAIMALSVLISYVL